MSEEINPENAAEGASPELTISDLQSIKQVIDVASQRGAFKPNEMVAVGTIYSKLESFLAAVAQAQPAPAEAAAEPKGE